MPYKPTVCLPCSMPSSTHTQNKTKHLLPALNQTATQLPTQQHLQGIHFAKKDKPICGYAAMPGQDSKAPCTDNCTS
jgi:hypothetical protein